MGKYLSLAALMFRVFLTDPQEWATYSFQDLIFSHMVNDSRLVPALTMAIVHLDKVRLGCGGALTPLTGISEWAWAVASWCKTGPAYGLLHFTFSHY